MEKGKIIFHIDVNSAYLSWESVRRLREAPEGVDLRMIPSAVGGDPTKRRGIILAKSIPAKRFGVKTGEPIAQALKKCPQLFLVPADHELYRDMSHAFIDVLRRFAPVIEQVSVDEAFCDMSGMENLYGPPEELAGRIRDAIREELGFTVNVGISSNKLLAKMASDMEKPDRTHTLFPEEIKEKMWPMPIGELFGVGHATAERLRQIGLRTIGDAAQTALPTLQEALGVKSGLYVHRAANGIGDDAVSEDAEQEKSYGHSTTLAEDLTAENRDRLLYPTLLMLSEKVGMRLRRDGQKGNTISVTMKTASFVTHGRQMKISAPTDNTNEIYQTACRLFDELWDGRTALRLIGVTVSGVDSLGYEQLQLFTDEGNDLQKEKMRKLDQMTDEIRELFGRDALVRGSLLEKRKKDK